MRDAVQDFGIIVLYAIAAISGGMGGCATALNTIKNGHRHVSFAFVCAYTVLGIVFGVLSIAAMYVLRYPPENFHQVIIIAASGGSCGSLALVAANYTARVFFRRMGFEIQVTLRRDHDERRNVEDSHEQT